MKYNYLATRFNLDILILDNKHKRSMTPITTLNILESSSTNFDKGGLFSTEIFGTVGSPERNSVFSYIPLPVPVLHPLIYKHIITTRSLYKEVMAGRKYAVYSKKERDLVVSTEQEGQTGYAFFMDVLGSLRLSDNGSDMRKFKLYMMATYGKPEYLMNDLLVMPAGMRDYKMGPDGRPEEDEVNDFYRRVYSLGASLANIKITPSTISSVDAVRFRIQEAILALYEHIVSSLDGKHRYIQGKWGTRGVLFGTRNVITPSISHMNNLVDDQYISLEHTTIGLYQYASAIAPVTMHKLHSTFVNRLFSPESTAAYLVNPKSMKTEMVNVNVKERDKWVTLEGIMGIIASLSSEHTRGKDVMVSGKYLLLLHDDGKTVTPVFDTNTMPEDMDPKYLRPIRYYELFYIALLDTFDKYRGLLTRYPVINVGGIYPSKTYVKTTVVSSQRVVRLNNVEIKALEYPDFKESYFDSLSPNHAYLDALGGDFDGDKTSYTILMTDDSIIIDYHLVRILAHSHRWYLVLVTDWFTSDVVFFSCCTYM